MNDIPDDMILEPTDERISEVRDGIFHDVIANHNAERQFNAERSRAGWWIGGIGVAVGVLGIIASTVTAIAVKPETRYREIDQSEGVIHASYGAKDAPDHFSDRVIRHYLAEHIELQEQFVWQLDPKTDHRIKLQSSPDEQKRYQARRDSENPLEKYGVNGYASVTWFDPNGFTLRAKGKDKTFEYDVQFIKSELLASSNQVTKSHMTARIVFQFHPEIMMSDEDRLDNEAGLYVIAYNSSRD